MIGEDALVPPTCTQPSAPCPVPSPSRMSHNELLPQLLYVSYTATPVFGSATAGWSKCLSAAWIVLSSEPPQLLEMETTPGVAAAVSSATPRSSLLGAFASTSVMWQSGQVAETMSRSRLISSAQP